MICVLGDLIADLALHIQNFPVSAKSMQRVTYLELGPGGAANVAIAAARLGLEVSCLGEIGGDRFGQLLVEDLQSEGITTDGIIRSGEAATPVALVVVDEQGEPAYLGFRGTLQVRSLLGDWGRRIHGSQALFADGWADHERVPQIILGGLEQARQAQVPVFFDPGPGNPEFDLTWHRAAAELATVLLLNESEAERLTGQSDPTRAAQALLGLGPGMVVVKRGPRGCLVCTRNGVVDQPAIAVPVVDTTGAGDSLDAAVIYGYLAGMELRPLALLANAAGAAKAQKRGTGRNVPTRAEILAVLQQAGAQTDVPPPRPALARGSGHAHVLEIEPVPDLARDQRAFLGP